MIPRIVNDPFAILLVLALAVCNVGTTANAHAALPTAPQAMLARLGMRPIHVHDPSPIIRCGKIFWIFSTGPGIISYYSTDLLHWKPGPRVFAQLPHWAHKMVPGNHNFLWAPDILFLHGRYLLYYAVSTFGAKRSVIGLATNKTLNPKSPAFDWKDRGLVIGSNSKDSFNAIDPGVIRTPGDRLWMSFGSFFSGIKLIELNIHTGLPDRRHRHIYSLAWHRTIEASQIFHYGAWYYLFVNWGYCCRGIHSTYNIRVGRSRRITGPYFDAHGTNMLQGGGTLFLNTIGPFIGPGQAGVFENHGTLYFTCHFYNGLRHGLSQLSILRMIFNSAGWPKLMLWPEK